MSNEFYLGDGLYASFDGYMIVLRAPRVDGQGLESRSHWVGLEPDVYDALTKWVALLSVPNDSPWAVHKS